MINPFIFSRVPEIVFGEGSYDKLIAKMKPFGNKALIVTGQSSFVKTRPWGKFIAEMSFAQISYENIKSQGEPSVEFIDSMVTKYRENMPHVIVAIGGGSAIDAGKAISAMLKAQGSVYEYLEVSGPALKHNGDKVPFIAVPTTAGTGSEMTKNAVISMSGENGFKSSLRHNNFVPNVAIVDPRLTLACPFEVSAASGLDALTQLMEAYLSTNASILTDTLALSGIDLILKNIETVCQEPTDLEARTNMAYASMLSGIVLANAGLGAVHGFATSVGGSKDIPHGVICGTLLGAVNRKNIFKVLEEHKGTEIYAKYLKMAKLMGNFKMKTDDFIIEYFAEEIDNKIKRLNIPLLSRYGITFTDVDQIVEKTNIKNNPVTLTKEELAEILLERV